MSRLQVNFAFNFTLGSAGPGNVFNVKSESAKPTNYLDLRPKNCCVMIHRLIIFIDLNFATICFNVFLAKHTRDLL